MHNPFIYGQEVSGPSFWNRKDEIKEISRDIQNGINVIISSPRRYGKTSLIKTILKKVKGKKIIPVYIDLYPTASKEEFVQKFATAVSNSIGTPGQKLMDIVKNLFPKLLPNLKINIEGQFEFEFDFKSINVSNINFSRLFNTVHEYALKQKKKACVVFDEFQEIANFDHRRQIEKEMRSVFQSHRNVSYIFMGSKKHLFTQIFNDPNRPFYKSGKNFPLEKLPLQEVKSHLKPIFNKGGLRVSDEVLTSITKAADGHPYYTQILCNILWDHCLDKKTLSEDDIKVALNRLIERESISYESILDGLTPKQKNLLMALSKSPQAQVFSSDFLKQNHLGSPSSIQKALHIVRERDILERHKGQHVFQDPFFAMWLKRKS